MSANSMISKLRESIPPETRRDLWNVYDKGIARAGLKTARLGSKKARAAATATTADASPLFVLTAAFGSMGDQALAAGSLELARLKGWSAHALVPGDARPWHDVGITETSTLDTWNSLVLRRVSDSGWRQLPTRDVYVIGADVIDGRYDHGAVSLRVQLLNAAASIGKTAKLINFSLSTAPTKASLALLRGLAPAVELWARDEPSQARGEQLLQRSIGLAPDVGAFLKPNGGPRVDALVAADQRIPIVLVPNAHMSTDFGVGRSELLQYWHDLAEALVGDGERVVLMPHDTRAYPDDPGFCQELSDKLSASGSEVELFVPEHGAQAKAVAATARLLIGARMHACVGSLSVGTPTLGLDYLDKFAGQFAWFGGHGIASPFDATVTAADSLASARKLLAGARGPSNALSADKVGWLDVCGQSR